MVQIPSVWSPEGEFISSSPGNTADDRLEISCMLYATGCATALDDMDLSPLHLTIHARVRSVVHYGWLSVTLGRYPLYYAGFSLDPHRH